MFEQFGCCLVVMGDDGGGGFSFSHRFLLNSTQTSFGRCCALSLFLIHFFVQIRFPSVFLPFSVLFCNHDKVCFFLLFFLSLGLLFCAHKLSSDVMLSLIRLVAFLFVYKIFQATFVFHIKIPHLPISIVCVCVFFVSFFPMLSYLVQMETRKS